MAELVPQLVALFMEGPDSASKGTLNAPVECADRSLGHYTTPDLAHLTH